MLEPKITVVIPTRERSDVLVASLKTVTSQPYDNLEILVSDNCSCDDTEDVVRGAKDSRVKYINTGKRVSMSDNWEFALAHVAGGWVTILGDDAGLLPDSLIKASELMTMTDSMAVKSASCLYEWPSVTGEGFGRLVVPLKSGYQVRNAQKWLARVGSLDLPIRDICEASLAAQKIRVDMPGRWERIWSVVQHRGHRRS